MTGRRWNAREVGIVALLVGVGLVLRIWIAQFGYFGYDLDAFKEWMLALHQHPWQAFYAQQFQVPPDHLPGTLWVLAVVGEFHRASGLEGTFPTLKAVGIAADLLVGVLVYLVARTVAGPKPARWAGAAYLLNPGPVLLSGLWGQWDAIALGFMLAALLAAMRNRLALSLFLITLSCLFKPQFALVGALLVVFVIATGLHAHAETPSPVRRVLLALKPVAIGGIASSALVTIAGAPFGVWLVPGIGSWTYLDRLRFAFDRYDGTTYGALGVWLLGAGSRTAPSDQVDLAGGLTPAMVSLGITVVALALSVLMLRHYQYTPTGLLVSSCTLLWAYLVFGTRMHERYLLPMIALLIVVSAVLPGVRVLAAVMSLAFAANLYLALTYYHWTLPMAGWRSSPVLMALSAIVVAGWGMFVAVAITEAPAQTRSTEKDARPATSALALRSSQG